MLKTTPVQKHPIVNALLRIVIPLLPIAIEYLERYIRQERLRRQYQHEAMSSMTKSLTIEEAKEILAIDPKCPGANKIPFPVGSEARQVAEKNFKKFFETVYDHQQQHQQQRVENTEEVGDQQQQQQQQQEKQEKVKNKYNQQQEGKGGKISKGKNNNYYLAGKFSGAYRILVDPDWDGKKEGENEKPK